MKIKFEVEIDTEKDEDIINELLALLEELQARLKQCE